jgi:hypothetical protein
VTSSSPRAPFSSLTGAHVIGLRSQSR